MDRMDFLNLQLEMEKAGEAYAVITLVRASKNTPRSTGKMIVCPDGRTVGTVGGSGREQAAVKDALACLQTGQNAFRTYRLDEDGAGQGEECGGEIDVYIEVFGAKPLLVMVGGGHVGSALLPLAKTVGFSTLLIDTRDPELIEQAVKAADRFVQAPAFDQGVKEANLAENAYVVIASYGHAEDGAALYQALQTKANYVGMIGAPRKINTIFGHLREQGVSEEALARVHSPIGLDLGGETPAEVAVSILAELLMVKNGRSGQPMKTGVDQ